MYESKCILSPLNYSVMVSRQHGFVSNVKNYKIFTFLHDIGPITMGCPSMFGLRHVWIGPVIVVFGC